MLLETTVVLLHLAPPLHRVGQRTLMLQPIMLGELVELVEMETSAELVPLMRPVVNREVVELAAAAVQVGSAELLQELQMPEMVA